MGFTVWYIRKLDILDKNNQEILKITNVKVYTKDKWYPLYEFTLNLVNYIEIIWREILSNWNSSIKQIGYVEKEKFLKNPLDYATSVEYIEQWYECPNCKQWHTLEKDNLFLCLECWFQWKEEKFL